MMEYAEIEMEQNSDLVAEPQLEMFFNDGNMERNENGTLRILSLFSGCGGMDLGLEGGFICHKKSAVNPDWVHNAINPDWVLLNKNRFRTVFACDILEDARTAWCKYMSRYDVNPEIFHLTSIVDLVKIHRQNGGVFPPNIDVVTGGFPCQDFSVAGKRKGFDSSVSHNGDKNHMKNPRRKHAENCICG